MKKIIAAAVMALALILTTGPASACRAAGPKKANPLLEMGIVPYPTAAELEAYPLPGSAVAAAPLTAEDIGPEWANIDDLRWLEPIARANKAVLLGENHYYRSIHNLCNRILFALNTFDSYPYLMMELPYSSSPFIDQYVGLADDAAAAAFFDRHVSGFASMEEDRLRLEHIRRWNKSHPDRRIHVGTYDIEHQYAVTLRDVLLPYFERNGRTWPVDPAGQATRELEAVALEMAAANAELKAPRLDPDLPFVTPAYIGCVIENLLSIIRARIYNFDYYRQRGIVRNLTDPRFHGRAFEESKVLIHGGSYHTPSKFPYPEGGNFLREGGYLAHDYAPTKGRTYSIRFDGLSFRLGGMAGFDMAAGLPCGSGYRYIVTTMQKAHKDGLLDKDGHYIIGDGVPGPETAAFYAVLFKAAAANDFAPFLVRSIDWDGLLKAAGEKNAKLADEIAKWRDEYGRYDALVFVPRSDILTLRRKAAAAGR
ncbi:MAG TPA: hypothetical protein P5119_10985 [Candidatus Aminicenantes bacterium]|nr:hypothetical protein [Candidatus Aminicenantes bacterium]HRY65851.1 hypothetical protein [Candidatus Aminicenantes bacterium]HRZ72823.1 hypothetical protein [Candidatus Aminicenantes bacterium]